MQFGLFGHLRELRGVSVVLDFKTFYYHLCCSSSTISNSGCFRL